MNYLLVMPKKLSQGADTTSIIFPVGIAYVSAALKEAGFSVFTLNLDFPEGDTQTVLQEMITTNHIDVVCTGGLSLDCHKIKAVIDVSRKINPTILTVVGGGIISSDPETAMRVIGADIGVIGEGERTMCELAHALDNGKPYDAVDGLVYRNTGRELVKTAPRKEIADIDSIPFPDYEGFNYGQWVAFYNGAGVLLSDRSCPFHCTFCFHPTGGKYRQRSLDNIFKEIDYQVEHFHIRSLGLSSELFAITKQRVFDFCERIKKYNITWSCCLRVPDVDAELLKHMKDSGCNLICYGLESADDSVLKSMRKGIKVEQIKRALDLTIEAGISTEASNFIFGDINETAQTVKNTMDFWWQYNHKTHINLSLIQTYPGTYLYDYACSNGIITDKEQFLRDGCPFINVSKLSSSEYHDITSLVAELRMHPHVPAGSVHINSIDENGICTIEYACRKCGTKNFTKIRFWFTVTGLCPSCRVKNEVDSVRGATCREGVFTSGLADSGPVVLWGAGGVYYKLMHQFKELESERFLLVDANPEQQGLRICTKIVQAPGIIAREGVQTVIITALSRKDDIYAHIRRQYPSVKKVLFPSYIFEGTEVVPILQTIQEPVHQEMPA